MKKIVLLVVSSLIICVGVMYIIFYWNPIPQRAGTNTGVTSTGTIRPYSKFQESINTLNSRGYVLIASVWTSNQGFECSTLQEFVYCLERDSIRVVYCDDDTGLAWYERNGIVTYVHL